MFWEVKVDFDELLIKMISAPSISFDELRSVPVTSGVYTAWLDMDARCFYVGFGKNLKQRIKSHFKGARGGNQFCLYVYDEYIHELRCRKSLRLNTNEIDRLTGKWIQSKVKFKWVELNESEMRDAEDFLKGKLNPILNPL